MKRKRLTQTVLILVGLFNLSILYFLCRDLWHSAWLKDCNELNPMFLSFFIPVGVALLLAARNPSHHRSMIALAAWWHISHGTVMAIQTAEAQAHHLHRNPADVIINLALGILLLALLPPKQEAPTQTVA